MCDAWAGRLGRRWHGSAASPAEACPVSATGRVRGPPVRASLVGAWWDGCARCVRRWALVRHQIGTRRGRAVPDLPLWDRCALLPELVPVAAHGEGMRANVAERQAVVEHAVAVDAEIGIAEVGRLAVALAATHDADVRVVAAAPMPHAVPGGVLAGAELQHAAQADHCRVVGRW